MSIIPGVRIMGNVVDDRQSVSLLSPTQVPTASARSFGLSVIDNIGSLLTESFRLRYQVYCVERQFLQAADYPRGLEFDQFDEASVHVGAVDGDGRLAGTARVVLPVNGTLPTLTHCTSSPLAEPLWGRTQRWVEVSRLSVSRSYGRTNHHPSMRAQGVRDRGDILLAVTKAAFLASKRLGATHILVSIERSLARVLTRNGFPFCQVGPQFDYLGAVAPYSMDISAFEGIARSGRYPQISDFVVDSEIAGSSETDSGQFFREVPLTVVVNRDVAFQT
jgi:N-acyl amino acid synthase of PEP-CTERM/exosortase system